MGYFITFEGIEGSGKSTQSEMVRDHLEWAGKGVVSVREPGGTDIGEKIRSILLSSEGDGMDPWAELFLYEASRAQLIRDEVKPALEEGKIVICDRYTDSTIAYQGYGRGLDIEALKYVNTIASLSLVPDLTIVVDCTPEVGLKRAWARIEERMATNPGAASAEDRFEKENIDFHTRVREGFKDIAGKEPERVKVVSGEGEIPAVFKEICAIIDKAVV